MKLSEIKISLKVCCSWFGDYSMEEGSFDLEVVKIINGFVIIKGDTRIKETNKCGLIAIPVHFSKWNTRENSFGVLTDLTYGLEQKKEDKDMGFWINYKNIQELFLEIPRIFKKCNCKQQMKLRDKLFNEKVDFGRDHIIWDERSKEEREKENNEWLINNGFEDLV